jgi:AcrR family transcriptional regulator
MSQTRTKASPSRGRPPSITRDRLADAGIALTLPKLTMVGVADELGVSSMALYKHVSGLEALKELVAEEIFLRWALPSPLSSDELNFKIHLESLSASMWTLVSMHPGVAPYLLREDMITPAMMDKIRAHQQSAATCYGLPLEKARWALFTVAYHCVAVADTILPKSPVHEPLSSYPGTSTLIPDEYARGIDALILGILTLIDTP